MSTANVLEVLLIKDSALDAWTAHGLQINVAGQGKTIQAALESIRYSTAAASVRAIEQRPNDDDALAQMVGTAPNKYWAQFSAGQVVEDRDLPAATQITVDPPVPAAVPEVGEVRICSG